MRADDSVRVLLLLLPAPLEVFERRALAEALMRSPGVVVVDPPRTSYARLARIPDAIGVTLANKQARRLRKRLPGRPVAVTIFDAAQYPLARMLLAQLPDAELWYGPVATAADDPRLEDLHLMASRRAHLVFDPHGEAEALWQAVARLELV